MVEFSQNRYDHGGGGYPMRWSLHDKVADRVGVMTDGEIVEVVRQSKYWSPSMAETKEFLTTRALSLTSAYTSLIFNGMQSILLQENRSTYANMLIGWARCRLLAKQNSI